MPYTGFASISTTPGAVGPKAWHVPQLVVRPFFASSSFLHHRAAFLDSPGPRCQNPLANKTRDRTIRSADAPLGNEAKLIN